MPKHEKSANFSFVAHSDQGGRPDGVQVIVHRGYAYVGHMFNDGFSVIDVRDPRKPSTVAYVPMPRNTRSHHLQVADDLLLAINGPSVWTLAQFQDQSKYFANTLTNAFSNSELRFSAGIRIYDIKIPSEPREIAFFSIPGLGVNRIWWIGGRYAYVAAHMEGYTDHIMVVVDLANPRQPTIVSQWWLPGQWTGGGEGSQVPQGKRHAAHHAIVAGGLAFGTWRDGGITIHDISDLAKPKMVSHLNWCPPFAGGTHTALPLPERNLLVVADEATTMDCANGVPRIWIVDIRSPHNPVPISTCPVPSDENYCRKGGKFGPHNLHENRPGSFQSSDLIFATYLNAGLRVYDIRDPFQPREAGYFVPADPQEMVDTRPGVPAVVQSGDLFVDSEGLVYLTDPNAGLHILQFEGR
ncbi:hypothetical protein [Cupriavidus oxalaticus]|uniref:LVIVD repeat-containing protein n=1 Tax=Cupriavidus oxalaticus TaxID=96344 RepID=UPI003181AAE1